MLISPFYKKINNLYSDIVTLIKVFFFLSEYGKTKSNPFLVDSCYVITH